jgi:hypothetical protein
MTNHVRLLVTRSRMSTGTEDFASERKQGLSYAAPFVKRVDKKPKNRSVALVRNREPLDRAVFFPYQNMELSNNQ